MRPSLFALLISASAAFAAPVVVVPAAQPFVAIDHAAVAPGMTVFSLVYDMTRSNYQGGQITCTGTNPHVQLQLLGATTNESTAFGLGAGCVDYTGPTPVNVKFDFIPMHYSRLAVVGQTDTSTDTICTVQYYLNNPTAMCQ